MTVSYSAVLQHFYIYFLLAFLKAIRFVLWFCRAIASLHNLKKIKSIFKIFYYYTFAIFYYLNFYYYI